jgi:hypothetical protein
VTISSWLATAIVQVAVPVTLDLIRPINISLA